MSAHLVHRELRSATFKGEKTQTLIWIPDSGQDQWHWSSQHFNFFHQQVWRRLIFQVVERWIEAMVVNNICHYTYDLMPLSSHLTSWQICWPGACESVKHIYTVVQCPRASENVSNKHSFKLLLLRQKYPQKILFPASFWLKQMVSLGSDF